MLALGISIYEPDPLAAIARIEEAQRGDLHATTARAD
jgi:hypothetical protein